MKFKKPFWLYFSISCPQIAIHNMVSARVVLTAGVGITVLLAVEWHINKHSLPVVVMATIKPIFKAFTNEDLLKKQCLHGMTQNPNENFHSLIWRQVPKTEFVRLQTLRLGVHDAVFCFNNGVIKKIDVLNLLGVTYG